MATLFRPCPIHGHLDETKTSKHFAKHTCSKTDCIFKRPSLWSHIEKRIAKCKAELASKRLARSMNCYLQLSLGMMQHFCPRHSSSDPDIVRYLRRCNSIFENNHHPLPELAYQVNISINGEWLFCKMLSEQKIYKTSHPKSVGWVWLIPDL